MYNDSGIYCYRNKINGKLYVGQATNLKKRYQDFKKNKRYSGSVIDNARRKYGTENFEYSILTHCPVNELNYWESFYIERLNCVTPKGYNMTNGGDSVYKSTREFKDKQEEILKAKILSKNCNLDVSKVHYTGERNAVTIICPIHGPFKKTPSYFNSPEINSLCCPKCVREYIRQKSENNFIQSAKDKWGNKYDYSKTIFIDRITPITITCPIHGDFTVLPGSHICKDKNSGGCQKCSEERLHNMAMEIGENKLKEKIKEIFGDKYSLEKFVYKGDREKVTLVCPIHGDFSARPNNLINSYGCPKCTLKNTFKNKYNGETNETVFINKAKIVHGDKYDYSKVNYIKSHEKVCIICPEHGEFWQKPNNHLNGYGCPKCGTKLTNKRKIILQYTLNGTFIKEWENYDEIIKAGITKDVSHIKSCCNGKRNKACGFIWKHKEDISNSIEPPILQLTKNNVLIKKWNNMSEIHKNKPIKSTQHIIRCLKGISKTAGGFIWKYD